MIRSVSGRSTVHASRVAAWVVCLTAVLGGIASAQGSMPLGFGGGTFAPKAGAADVPVVQFAHAIAYRTTDQAEGQTVVLLSTQPLEERRARDDAYLTEVASAPGAFVLQVRIAHANGAVLEHATYDARGRVVLAEPHRADWTRTTFNSTRIEGRVSYYPEIVSTAVVQPGYLVLFNARVRAGQWVEPGEVRGTLRLASRHFDLQHVAIDVNSVTATVVLSSKPVDEAFDREALAAAARTQDFGALWTTIERKTGKVVASRCLGPGVPGADVEAPGGDWHREDWNARVMRGSITTDVSADAVCLAEAYFAVTPP